jgi:hypothetical protein
MVDHPMFPHRLASPVTCSECGSGRSAESASESPRSPCPECGSTAISVQIGVADEVNVAVSVSVALQPADQERGWQRRLAEANRDLDVLLAPQWSELSGDAIHAARHRLHSVYIHAYHVKDALKADSPSHGVSRETIEAAISGDPDLALLADLANLDKHGNLTRPSRSGHVPEVVSVKGVRAGSGSGGWRLEVAISHAGREVDGLVAARRAVDAWSRRLGAWGLT